MPLEITSKRPWRVVVDANAWVSRYLTPGGAVAARLRRVVRSARFEVIFSEELRNEVSEVIQRDKFRRFIKPEELRRYLRQVRSYKLHRVTSVVTACRDPKDNYLLALSLDSQADYLLTGDKDLLVLQRFGTTEIITWTQVTSLFGLDERRQKK